MDREEIEIIERPESVSWEQVSFVLKKAHEDNVRNGIVLPYPQLPPWEIKEKIEGQGGVLFVALSGEQLVATGAVRIIKKNIWCGSGDYAYCCFAAVLPEYAGRGIYRRIEIAEEEYAKSKGINRMMFDTDERNKRILSISKKNGYRFVDYRIREERKSVLLVKWLDKCPCSRIKCTIKFLWIKYHKIFQRKQRACSRV